MADKRLEGSMQEIVTERKGFTILRLLSYFRYQKGRALLALCFAVLVNVGTIAQPYILKVVIDQNLAKGIYDGKILVTFGLFYMATVIVSTLSTYAQTITLTKLGQTIMHKLRTSLFSHIQKLGMGFFDRNSSGKILTRINSDIESLSDLFSSTLLVIVKDVILVVGIIAAMFSMNAKLGWWCMWSVPAIGFFVVFFRIVVRKNFMRVKAQLSKINSFLAENITGMKNVQIYAKEEAKMEEFHEMGDKYCKMGIREILLSSLSHPFINAISNIMIALIIGLFASQVKMGLIEVGVIYAFTTYIKQLFAPIAEIADQFTTIQSALISADRVFALLDTEDYIEDFSGGIRMESLKGDIEFRNVWFAYEGDNYVLKNVSFVIGAGERCAFVGATGSGKSTIISLLARFYDIQKGEILIDGVDIRKYNLVDLRRCIAVVMQDVFLFSGDIKYNIRLNNEKITDEDIARVVESIHADEFVESLEGGYSHQVSERGVTFSAGERQIVAFARAVAFNPSILVLDEATANIDTKTEVSLQNALDHISRDHTVIIIAHRLATVVSADQIFVMQNGEIAERGTHTGLYEQNGLYTNLYNTSIKSNEVDKVHV